MKSKFKKPAPLYVLIFALTLSLFCAARGYADDTGAGRQLYDIFLRLMNADETYLQLAEQPRDDGYISWGYLECKNAKVRGMNIRSLRMDCFDAQVSPVAEWPNLSHPRIQSMLSCHAEGIFTEEDVNDFLRSRLFGRHAEWERVSVKMRDGRISAEGYYNLDLKLFRTKIKVGLDCAIVAHRTELWLDDIHIAVNNQQISTGMIGAALRELQPFIDMKRFNLPLYLSRIEFEDGLCRVRSRILPKPLTLKRALEYGSAISE